MSADIDAERRRLIAELERKFPRVENLAGVSVAPQIAKIHREGPMPMRVDVLVNILRNPPLHHPFCKPAAKTGRPRKQPQWADHNVAMIDRRKRATFVWLTQPQNGEAGAAAGVRARAVLGDLILAEADRQHAARPHRSMLGLAKAIDDALRRPRRHGERGGPKPALATIRRVIGTAFEVAGRKVCRKTS